METHQILFMNKHMKDALGEDLTGQSCHQGFKNKETPCLGCTHEKLVGETGDPMDVYVWEEKKPPNRTIFHQL